jgi:hypothetical protein
MTWSKFCTEDPQLLGNTVQHLIQRATWRLGVLQPPIHLVKLRLSQFNRFVMWPYSSLQSAPSAPITRCYCISATNKYLKINRHVPCVSPAGAPSVATQPGRFSWWPAGNRHGPPGLMTSWRLTSCRWWGRRRRQQQCWGFYPGPGAW